MTACERIERRAARGRIALALALAGSLWHAATPAVQVDGAKPPAAAAAACEPRSTANDRQEVQCDLVGTGAVQRHRFAARFSGSHDDTRVSLSASLNGAPLVCDEGSKTRLEGEDGEVELSCRFAIREPAGTQHALRVRIVWYHAQYTDYALEPE